MEVFSDSIYRVSQKKHVNLVTTFTSSLFHTLFFVHSIIEEVVYDRMNPISNEQYEKWDFNVLNRRKLSILETNEVPNVSGCTIETV